MSCVLIVSYITREKKITDLWIAFMNMFTVSLEVYTFGDHQISRRGILHIFNNFGSHTFSEFHNLHGTSFFI